MAFWLASKRDGQATDWIHRFDPRFWTVNFPRPMMASLITTAHDALRVDVVFLRKSDLAGLIWESEDRLDHPLLSYKTATDYSNASLSFHWRSSGVLPLDAVNGPTLTIEGRDQAGAPRTWYVRLWNYAVGGAEDATITLKFSELEGGFLLPDESDPVWPGSIDRLFISMVAPGYDGADTGPLDDAVEGFVELSQIRCEGRHASLEIGDVIVPPHGIGAATAFDDCGNQAPARVLRNLRHLGYRGSIVHYVGMSHYFRLAWDENASAYLPAEAGDPLCIPARAWHRAFFEQCDLLGFSPIASLSYELLAQHCPEAWQQRAYNGQPGLTGWDPPSALLSPANAFAMGWLQSVAREFTGIMRSLGLPVRFQIGEPWWWTTGDGRICIYDGAAQGALGSGVPLITDMRQPLTAAQQDLLDRAGALLAQSTAALAAAVRFAAAPASAELLLLIFPPTVLDPSMPEALRANMPIGWASPAFDRLQVEDYDWLTAGAEGARREAYVTVNQRLGYPPQQQDYFVGFVLLPQDKALWRRIDAGIDEALARQPHEIFVWAQPQIVRDGYVRLPEPEQDDADMNAFDNVLYPLALGRDATIVPEFSTSVSVTASGFERRNSLWSDARLRFDVGPGIRSEAELGTLIAFFRARRGAARGFLLRDPSDYSSSGMVGTPGPVDQLLGIGDGAAASFDLVKHYGDGDAIQRRRITRPRADTVEVSINGVRRTTGWTLQPGGRIVFASAPAEGADIRAGYLFDVPVRFADDKLEIAGAAFAAGEAPSVPVIEIREAS